MPNSSDTPYRTRHTEVASVRTLAGMDDQDPTCRHGDAECARPGSVPCFECVMGREVEDDA